MQPGSAEVSPADRIEDPECQFGAEQPARLTANAVVTDVIDRAIVVYPGHPGAEMIARLIDRGEDLLRVALPDTGEAGRGIRAVRTAGR